MDLWSRITGIVTVELTAAEPERILGAIAGSEISVFDVVHDGALRIVFRIRRSDLPQVEKIAVRHGGKLKPIGMQGGYYWIREWRKQPVLLLTLILLLAASVFVPGRILFVQVQGNDAVPTRLIREIAAQYGLEFGAARRDVRSEGIKNELLDAIEQLEWVGVNTSGCTAVITVRERELQPQETSDKICNVVACTDGIIEDITMIRGTLLCTRGQAVRAGQLLVSGYKDLGICARVVGAEAEIYARTNREYRAILPEKTIRRQNETGNTKKFSLVIGKKRINLYSDSGILPSTCGKMTQVISLRLPGGMTLPVCLVVESCTQYDSQTETRQEESTALWMEDAAQRYLRSQTLAGQILEKQTQTQLLGDHWEFHGRYECREMIARQDNGVYLEGETKDDPENSERGAG